MYINYIKKGVYYMLKIGGYLTIVPTKTKTFKQMSSMDIKSKPRVIKMFVAGGPEVDIKVEAAQKEVLNSLKQEVQPAGKEQAPTILAFFKSFFK